LQRIGSVEEIKNEQEVECAVIRTKTQNAAPATEPEAGRPAGSGEQWLGRNRSAKRRLWEQLNPRNRKQIRLIAEALAQQQTHARLPEPLRIQLSAAIEELERVAGRIGALLTEIARKKPSND
jgi:hypothetical protein